MTVHEPVNDATGRYYDRQTRGRIHATTQDELALLGTVTHDEVIVRHRDKLERFHLDSILRLKPTDRVLDLGGGAGRIAYWIADRVEQVVLVDSSAELIKAARYYGTHNNINNVTCIHDDVMRFEADTIFDVIICFGLVSYLDDTAVDQFVRRCDGLLRPGGTLILKDPVSTDDETRVDHRYSEDGQLEYAIQFRPRSWYPRRLAPVFTQRYQRATCAHFFPWFVGGTEQAVATATDGWAQGLLNEISPLLVRLDPLLLSLEEVIRADKTLSGLLATVDVVQDLYMFTKPVKGSAGTPTLSIVVIAYNEDDCLVPVVLEMVAALSEATINFEIVIVNDGSTDETAAQAENLVDNDNRIRVIHQENKGIGGALRTGFNESRGDYITWIPADGQISPDTVLKLYECRHAASMITTVYRTRDDPWYRTVISQTLNTIIKIKTGEVAKSGGNYIFSSSAWKEHGPQEDDSMMISTAFRQNLRRVGQAPVEIEIDCRARQGGRSKVLNPKTLFRTARQVLKMDR